MSGTRRPADGGRALETLREALAKRRLPEATYRVQLHAGFRFRDASAILPYLERLGIGDLYASSYLKARPGSTHGYDILNHGEINPEIGSREDHDALANDLRERGMGLVLDTVPNHMCIASDENSWWTDVLENGPSSPYASYFDIDWEPLKRDIEGKILLPVLEDRLGLVLEGRRIEVLFEDGAFFIGHGGRRFPAAPRTYSLVLRPGLDALARDLPETSPDLIEIRSILTGIEHLPPRWEVDPERLAERRREKEVIRRRLSKLASESAAVRGWIEGEVRAMNGVEGDPRSFDRLEAFLDAQPYRLAWWRVASDEINYRRFFDVNELAAINAQNEDVFEATHRLVLELVKDGLVTALRIDHPDGLYDPLGYLRRLQERRLRMIAEAAMGTGPVTEAAIAAAREIAAHDPRSPFARPLPLYVEKILEPGEALRDDWPVEGTTGYEFLGELSGLFVDSAAERRFDRLYTRFTGRSEPFEDLLYRSKKLIQEVTLASEVSVLGHELDRISERNRWWRDFTRKGLTDALREVIAAFPVYRSYVRGGVGAEDRRVVESAVAAARRRNPAISGSLFDFIRDALLLEAPDGAGEEMREEMRRFASNFQQVTGPVMAKGLEDTAAYIHVRLASLNEVGGDPSRFGASVGEFHARNTESHARYPRAMLATSTHDTKRSEDVRARIHVLSEMPAEWQRRVFLWSRLCRRLKTTVAGEPCPTRNDEWLLYQSLVGIWPIETPGAEGREAIAVRVRAYMEKATREAKVRTSWIQPDESYERATRDFVSRLLDAETGRAFLADFEPFALAVARLGAWNSLSQTLLKIGSPGVPDVYQGTETFDFSLVDPDNRRPVDYETLSRLLAEIETEAASGLGRLAASLAERPGDPRQKLFVAWRALRHRRESPGLFSEGEYVPLEAEGAARAHVVAFMRRDARREAIVIAPRLVAGLLEGGGGPPAGAPVWRDTRIVSRAIEADAKYRNVFTGETVAARVSDGGAAIDVAAALAVFPVALLARDR